MRKSLLFAIFCLNLTACTPKVQLETPAEGITINMNVVVNHRIDVKFDEKSRTVLQTSDNKAAKSEAVVEAPIE
ncbi:YnbE family lipoprotein [Actinobacillus pleuropneumoniae]|uniref:YnbE family lipoprotein n=1 Tax=Actinobacillus pleuropneumoniae TaxID=715 RepID=UPI00223CD5C6|nr:YnbE family lipoprotein [Actinobacillus pleuropneumoniae]